MAAPSIPRANCDSVPDAYVPFPGPLSATERLCTQQNMFNHYLPDNICSLNAKIHNFYVYLHPQIKNNSKTR